MSFNPAASYTQGLQMGQQNKIAGLKNALAGQMQQQGFNPQQSNEFNQLLALDPAFAGNAAKTFNALEDSRKKAFFQDAQSGLRLLQAGNEQGFLNLANNRLEQIQKLGGDPSDVIDILQTYQSGDVDGTVQKLQAVEQGGVALGFLQDPLERQIQEAKLAQLKSGNQNKAFKTAEQIEREVKVEEEKLNLRKGELRQRQVEASKPKLSAKAENAIIKAQDQYFESGKSARKMELLADDFNRLNVGGGLSSTISESLKAILGSQDEVTAARKRFNAIRSSQATSNLPPGPASDKDIELALSGFPKENANASQVLGFLRGQAKLARIDEKFHEFKAEYISNSGKAGGLISAWKSKLSEGGFLDDIINPKDAMRDAQQMQLSDDDLLKKYGGL